MPYRKIDIVYWFQTLTAGAISLISTVFSSAIYATFPNKTGYNWVLVVVSVSFAALVFATRRYLPDIEMTCVQDSQFFDIKDLHHRTHPVYNGYAEIEAYADIPSWMNEFEIEIDTNSPLKISKWTPQHISETEDTIICRQDIDDFKFEIQVLGEADELGDTVYNLYFRNAKTNRQIYSIKIDTQPNVPQVDEDALTEEEAEEWGIN